MKEWRRPVEGLTFEPNPSHIYRFKGRIVPSVTTVLDGVLGRNGYRSAAMEAGMMRGRAVHLATQYYDEGRLNQKTLHPAILPFFQAYKDFLRDVAPEIVYIEQPVYHETLEFAGTLDRVIIINGDMGVLDIKTGASAPRHTGPQLSAYAESIRLGHLLKRWALVLRADGQYRLSQYTDDTDWDVFQAALLISRWKERSK